MIVTCVLDPETFIAACVDPAEYRAGHRRFIRLWGRYGALLRGADEDLCGLVAKACDQEVRKLWQAALRRNRVSTAGSGLMSRLDKAAALEEITKAIQGADLVCLDGARAQVIGLPDAAPSVMLDDDHMELCRFFCVDESEAFRRAEKLSQSHITAGTDTSVLWQERFAGLARFSRHVVVMDPYCLHDHIAWKVRHNREPSGLRRLLTGVDETAVPHLVTVYCMVDEQARWDERRAAAAIEQEWRRMARGGVRAIALKLSLSPKSFKAQVHDRYVRFDSAILNLGEGLQVLSGRKVGRYCSFSLEEANGPTEIELKLAGNLWECEFSKNGKT